jgi:BirA family transcriptional regulator, biotin operon repressor / biotin---[acetyl-CoA-carboxylase] ligase
VSAIARGVGPDLVRAPALVAERGGLLGRPMWLLSSTSSTNDEAKRAARQGAPHGATWVAEEQTAGRGRQGRTWVSPAGENLLFSVLVRAAIAPPRVPQVALVAGLAVHSAVLAAIAPRTPKIKWPNDIVVAEKKIAGVLVEAITTGRRVEAVVIGVGINVHTRAFPDEIEERATSVALWSRDIPDRAAILADTLAAIDADLGLVVARGLPLLRARLQAADGLVGQRVRNDAGDEGVASGIDDEGRLRVKSDDGAVARWAAGEVHLV